MKSNVELKSQVKKLIYITLLTDFTCLIKRLLNQFQLNTIHKKKDVELDE